MVNSFNSSFLQNPIKRSATDFVNFQLIQRRLLGNFLFLLGALNVWLGKHPGLIVAHLTLATILWGTVVYAAASLLEAPARSSAPVEGHGPETQAVTA